MVVIIILKTTVRIKNPYFKDVIFIQRLLEN